MPAAREPTHKPPAEPAPIAPSPDVPMLDYRPPPPPPRVDLGRLIGGFLWGIALVAGPAVVYILNTLNLGSPRTAPTQPWYARFLWLGWIVIAIAAGLGWNHTRRHGRSTGFALGLLLGVAVTALCEGHCFKIS